MRDLVRVPRDQMAPFERAYFDRVRAELHASIGAEFCVPCFESATDHGSGCTAPREPLFPRHGNSPVREVRRG